MLRFVLALGAICASVAPLCLAGGGAEGGPTIIPNVANMLVGLADYGLDIQEAVNAPRVHQQWLPDRIELELRRISPDTIHLLQGAGNRMVPVEIVGDSECIEIDLA